MNLFEFYFVSFDFTFVLSHWDIDFANLRGQKLTVTHQGIKPIYPAQIELHVPTAQALALQGCFLYFCCIVILFE